MPFRFDLTFTFGLYFHEPRSFSCSIFFLGDVLADTYPLVPKPFLVVVWMQGINNKTVDDLLNISSLRFGVLLISRWVEIL